MWKRARELEPVKNEAHKIWLETPDIKPANLRRLLLDKGCPKMPIGTLSSWLNRFRKKTEKGKPPVVAEKGEVPAGLTSADIADALLKRVVEALNRYDNLLKEVTELKEYKSRAIEAEKALEKEKTEKERILKLHNEQVKSRMMTSADDLVRLARL